MNTNEVVRATIIWDLEETLKKRDAEIERLREALRTIAMSHLEKDDRNSGWGYCILIAKTALQQKDSE